MSEELVCHFGKHQGTKMSEIPTGYLRWAVAKIDPVPLPQYRKDEDGNQLSVEAVQEMERKMREFLKAAEIEIAEREANGEEK